MAQISESFAQTYSALVAWALTWWLGGEDAGLPALRASAGELRAVSHWLTAAGLAISVVVAGALLTLRRRGSDLADLLLGLARTLLTVSAGWLLIASTWTLGDAVARWIIGPRPAIPEFRTQVLEAVTRADPAIGMTLSIVGIGCCLAFVATVLARFVLAVVLAVGLPVLAATSLVRGRGGWRLALAWLAAVLAFKPLSAVVYRVGHGLLVSAHDPVLVLLISALVFLLAAGLLPAVARVAAVPR